MEDWTKWLDSSKCIDTIFLNFHKAFDSVPHARLLSKLAVEGITGKKADWIRDFLTNRHQRVIVKKGKSKWANVISGIPQGSVISPPLFVIFINDVHNVVTSTVQIFSDDTTLYGIVNDIGDEILLHEDLNKLHQWSVKIQCEEM